MTETLHPGVYLVEKGGQPLIAGVGVSAGGLVGICKKGPLDEPGLATSWGDYQRLYGGFYKNSYAAISAFLFFENGGERLYVARVAGAGALTATSILKSMNNTADAIDCSATSVGAWGDNMALYTAKYVGETNAILATGEAEIELKSLLNVELGDRVIISDGVTTVTVTILTINLSTNVIGFAAVTLGAPIPSGSDVRCSSTHRSSTTISADLETGATVAYLTEAGSVVVGSVITFASAAQEMDVVVTAVNGNQVAFAAVTLSATIVSGSIAVTQEFNLRVYDQGTQTEGTHQYLSMESTNSVDYFENRLSGNGNQSFFVELLIDTPIGTLAGLKIPYPVENAALSGGNDGTTPVDGDYTGSSVLGAETGLHLFDKIDELNLICIPGVTSITVESYLITWCQNRAANADPVFPLLDVPYAYDTALEAKNFKEVQLNRDTSHGGLFYPWYIFNSPDSPTTTIDIPPSGANMGIYSRVASLRGVHKAPANEEVRGIVGLTHRTTDGEQDILNPIGVNVTRIFTGRGIRLFGARTLTTTYDGRHYVHKRLTLNYIEESIAEALMKYVFEPHHEDTWDQMRLEAQVFLNTMWSQGALQPRDDRSQAYFVKIDETNNPQSERDLGRLNIEVGVNIVGTAEFIIFTAGLWDGGALIQEVT